jgi:hypothetical protein
MGGFNNGIGIALVGGTGGSVVTPALPAYYVGYGDPTNQVTGNDAFIYNPTSPLFKVGFVDGDNFLYVTDTFQRLGADSFTNNATYIRTDQASKQVIFYGNRFDPTTFGTSVLLDGNAHTYYIGDVDRIYSGAFFELSEMYPNQSTLGVIALGNYRFFSLDSFNGVYSIGDIDTYAYGNYFKIDDGSAETTGNVMNAYLGSQNNIAGICEANIQISTTVFIPTTSVSGSFNFISDSGTGDVALVGSGDLSNLGYGGTASGMAHFLSDNSESAYVICDNNGTQPRFSAVVKGGASYFSAIATPTQIGLVGSVNGTGISIDDSLQKINFGAVPSYATNAAAATAGLTTGNLYKTTSAGSTYLKIYP